jgi:hypothetical protein
MAYFGFTNKLVKGEKIQIFNNVNCKRDFTFVDNIVEGVIRVIMKASEKQVGEDGLPVPLLMPCITSATATPRISWSLWTFSSRSSSVLECSLATTASMPTRNSFLCNRVMYQ